MKSEVLEVNENPNVTLTTYVHDLYPGMEFLDERPAILVLPGGGYRMCSDSEAEPIALAYMAEGFQAFVLRYSIGENSKFPNPLHDAEDALALIQENADAWHVKKDQIAVIGFSAGGHLAACLGTMGRIRPAAMVLLYAITEQTQQGIVPFEIPDTVGTVDHTTPPAFLTAATQDPIVSMSNSLQFAQALDHAEVPFELHIFQEGGHGFSLGKRHVGDGNIAHESRNLPSWFSLSVDWLYGLLGDFEVPEIVFENPKPQKCDEYSIDVTLVTLWENSKCRNILTKYVPQLADEKTRKPAMGISIRTIAKFTPDIFSDGVLDKIDAELREV